jgi:VanZ family protein
MAATFAVSHQSRVEIPFGAPDYIGHGVSYAVLGALLMRALAGGTLRGMRTGLILPAVLIAAVYGVSDEFHQSFIPGRMASVSDIVADGVGALVGACAAACVRALLLTRTPPT